MDNTSSHTRRPVRLRFMIRRLLIFVTLCAVVTTAVWWISDVDSLVVIKATVSRGSVVLHVHDILKNSKYIRQLRFSSDGENDLVLVTSRYRHRAAAIAEFRAAVAQAEAKAESPRPTGFGRLGDDVFDQIRAEIAQEAAAETPAPPE